MSARSTRNLQLTFVFALLLAVILVVGFALAPSEFKYQAWPSPPSGSVIDPIVSRPAPESRGMPLADVSPRHSTAGATAPRPGAPPSARRGLLRRESSLQRGRRARPRGRGSRPARPGPAPAQPDRGPAPAPDPETPPAQPGGDVPVVAEVPAAQPTLRPTEPETPVQAPPTTIVVGRGTDSGQDGDGNGGGDGRGHHGNGHGNGRHGDGEHGGHGDGSQRSSD
jgi:hypothetical protein